MVLTVFDTAERILGALAAGAQGYLLKGAPRAEIFAAIRTVRAGGALIPPVAAAWARRLAGSSRRKVSAPSAASRSAPPPPRPVNMGIRHGALGAAPASQLAAARSMKFLFLPAVLV